MPKLFSNNKKHIYLCLLLVILSVSLLLFPRSIYAQSVTDNKLTVSPIRSEYNIEPGETKLGKIKVTNNSPSAMSVSLSAESFRVINPEYDYEFNAKSKTVEWVRFSQDNVELKSGASQTIEYSVNIPSSAEPGGYYLSIFSTTNTKSDDISNNSQQRVASLLYINVLGNVTKTGNLVSFIVPWLTNDNSMWSISLHNTGTTHFRSVYKIRLIDFFGKVQDDFVTGNPLVLPGTVREISGLVPVPKFPGLYKLQLNASLGDSRQASESRYIFYAPIWFVIVCALLLSSAITTIIIKKRNN